MREAPRCDRRPGTAATPPGRASPSSITTRRPASPKARPDSLDLTSSTASSIDAVTSTPLPAASPSVFTTYGGARLRRYSCAASTSPAVNVRWRAVGTPAPSSTSFIHSFEPSRRAPSAPGPTTRRPAARRRSASPATRGSSGPITYRSASSSSAGAGTEPGMPGFPGVTTTSAERRSTSASACSRPPEPTTQTAHQANCTYWSRPGPVPDEAHGHPDLALHEVEVAASLAGQVGHLAAGAQIGLPAGELDIHRGDVVEHRLVVRHRWRPSRRCARRPRTPSATPADRGCRAWSPPARRGS